LTDSQDYDLVVGLQGGLSRVQVKTTSYRKAPGRPFYVSLSVKGGNRSSVGRVKPFDPEAVDHVFVLTSKGQRYLIPSSQIRTKHSLTLGAKYRSFRI
jgi:hypothetical protein